MQAVTWLTITGTFVVGVVLALLGSMKLDLAKRLDISETRFGGLVSALHLALAPAMLLSGILVDRLGLQGVLIVGSLNTALAVWSFAAARSYARALVSVVVLGCGAACVSVATTVLMPEVFFGRNEQVAASLNLGNVFFALGADYSHVAGTVAADHGLPPVAERAGGALPRAGRPGGDRSAALVSVGIRGTGRHHE